MKTEKIVYISGPITGMHDGNRMVFQAVAKAVRNLGHLAKNPHEFCDSIPKDAEWEVFMRRGISYLPNCTDIIMLPKWSKSRGAKLEHDIAVALGIRVHYNLKEFKESLTLEEVGQ